MSIHTKINEGSFGSVYRPPVRCDGTVYDDRYVGKITGEEDVEAEIRAGALIRKLDPDGLWSITAIKACNVNPSNVNEGFTNQLIYRYGGVPLVDLMMADDSKFEYYMLDEESEWDRLSVSGFDKMIQLIAEFLPNLEKLNDLYQHNDLHLKNLVYDGEKIRMIDFATLINNRDLKKELAKLKRRQYTEYGVGKNHIENVMNNVDRLLDDDVKQTDIYQLFKAIFMILESPWGEAKLNRKYKYWMSFNRRANTYEKLMRAIREMPASA